MRLTLIKELGRLACDHQAIGVPCRGLLLTLCFLVGAIFCPARQVLPPGPVKITVSGTAPKSGFVGTEWTGEFIAHVEGGSGEDAGATWKWAASVIKDDPASEDDTETGIGEKSQAISTVWDPATGSGTSKLTLRFREVGTYHMRTFVEFANKEANTIGVSESRLFRITISPSKDSKGNP